jgi:2-phosphosulfolactate phosphatase
LDIDVAFAPSLAANWQEKVCIVVDVIRASSAIVTLLEGGVERVIPVRTLDLARQLARPNGWVLAGEKEGIAPADFDFSNSPVELAGADLRGRVVVLATTNGTVLLDNLKDSRRVFVGSFLNAGAVCRAALGEAARLGLGVGIACAGHYGAFVLDDAVCAGYLAEQCQQLVQRGGGQAVLSDAALAASQLYHSFPSIVEAFLRSLSGKRVIEIGTGEDNSFCAQVDASQVVPVLVKGELPYLGRWEGCL